MTALVCVAMVVPAGVLSVATAVYISSASHMMTAAEGARGFWSWSCLSVAWGVLGSRCSDSFRC